MSCCSTEDCQKSQGTSVWRVSFPAAFLAVVAVIPGPTNAATLAIPVDVGFVSTSDGSYITDGLSAVVGVNSSTFRRGWFFDLSSLTEDIIAAELIVTISGPHSNNNVDPTERIDLYAVSATRQQLIDGDTFSGTPPSPLDIFFDDFGSGVFYGSLVVDTSSSTGTLVTASLDSSAIGAINDAAGGDFAIGFVLGTLDSGTSREFVGVTGSPSQHTLMLTTAIPEPSTLTLAALGMLGLGMVRRRRRSLVSVAT